MKEFVNKIRRAETPGYRRLKRLAGFVLRPPGPRIPRFFKPVGRVLYGFHYFVISTSRKITALLYYHPLFQSRCSEVGRNLVLEGLPYVTGPMRISLGDDVVIGGRVGLQSGRSFEAPQLKIGNRSIIGWDATIVVNKQVTIDDDVLIAPSCRISDSDGHPRDAIQRARHMPPDPADSQPIHICRYAWIGACSHIMKGVTIGEGAIIGSNSVVISDIPPYSIAFGNPAEVYFRNINKKSKAAD